jgi:hypothetical protein
VDGWIIGVEEPIHNKCICIASEDVDIARTSMKGGGADERADDARYQGRA